jgi:hypothetical protein
VEVGHVRHGLNGSSTRRLFVGADPNLVVLRFLVEPGQNGSRLWRHDGDFIVFAGKRAHGVERIESHDGDELHFVAMLPPQELDIAETGYVPVLNAGKNFFP